MVENGKRPSEYKKHDYTTGKIEIDAIMEMVQEKMIKLLNERQELSTLIEFLIQQTEKTWKNILG